MLGSGALVTVRQEQHEAAEALPLGLTRTDELVDDDLRAVGEIAVLGLPDHQTVRLGRGIAVLEPHDGLFRQHGVEHLHARLMLADMLQRQEGVVGILVVQHRVPMEEGAASAVLAAEADREAVLDERRTGERLGAAPVERLLAGEHLLAVGDDLSDARMQRKARRNAGDALA